MINPSNHAEAKRCYTLILDEVARDLEMNREYLETSGSTKYSQVRAGIFEGLSRSGLSHDDIAWVVGMTRQTIQIVTKKWFRSGRRPPPETRRARELAIQIWREPETHIAANIALVPTLDDAPKRLTGADKLREWEKARDRRKRIQGMFEQDRGAGYAPSPVATGLY